MTVYGLTSTGFVAKTQDILESDMKSAARAAWGALVAADPVLSDLISIVAERYAELWDLGQATYGATDPNSTAGVALDALCALSGTVRKAATHSTWTTDSVYLTGTAATPIPSGSQAKTSVNDVFETTADATLAAATAWAGATVYALNDIVTNNTKIYICTTAGTSAASGGPTTNDADITDNTAHWHYLGDGAAYAVVAAQSVETGVIPAIAYDLTQIVTPVAGWQGVNNTVDAVTGTEQEKDGPLRLRRVSELGKEGASTPSAVLAKLSEVSGVTSVHVFANRTDTTDADGVPPHSIEALVQGGADQDIWDAVFAGAGDGIGLHGTEIGTTVDSAGETQDVAFSRPDEQDVWVDITLIKDPATYPADGDTQVKEAIATVQPIGLDVVASRVGAAAFKVDGVLDVTATRIGLADPPVASTTIAITSRQLAVFDTTRITVNTADGTP